MAVKAPVPVIKYPSNSMKSRSAKAQSDSIHQPKTAKRQSAVRSAIEEHSDEVKSYIIYDILAPAIKDMISSIVNSAFNALKDAIETSLYGAPKKTYRDHTSYTDYSKRYQSGYPKPVVKTSYNDPSVGHRGTRPVGNFNDIDPCGSRGDAEKVLGKLIEQIAVYGEATVGDYYDLMGITSDFTDRKWGWKDLSQAGTYRDKSGYRVDLPDPQPL